MALAIIFRRKLAETIALSMAIIVGVLYVYGLLNREGSLWFGICFILLLTISSVVYLVYIWRKKREQLKEAEFLSGIILYYGLFAVALFLNYGRVFHMWDEFTHWGFSVMHFFILDAYGTVSHPYYELWVPNYLPGTTLVQYFFVRFSGTFTEFHTFIGMNMLYFVMVMPFVKDIFTKKGFLSRTFLLIIFGLLPLAFSFSPYFISTFYGSLYVDMIIGMLFGISIMYYFFYRYEESVYSILMVAGTTFVLATTKDIGLILSLGVSAIIMTDILLFRRSNIVAYIKEGKSRTYQVGRLILLFLPLLLSLFVHLTWSNLLRRSETDLNAHVPTVFDIRNFFTGNLEPDQLQVRQIFWEAIFHREVPYFQLSTFWFSIVFVVLLITFSILFCEGKQRKRFIVAGICLSIGFYLYQFIYALIYVFSFLLEEGIRLASFGRYMSTYMLAMILFLLVILIISSPTLNLKGVSSSKRLKPVLFILICVCFFVILLNVTYSSVRIAVADRMIQPNNFRPRPTAVVADRWMEYFEGSLVYFIDQGGRRVNFRKMQFDLLPNARLANVWFDYNVQLPGTTLAEYEFAVTPEEWEARILRYGFQRLFIYRSNETLETHFGHFFVGEIIEEMMYDVVNEDGNLRLVPIMIDEQE